MSLAFCLSQKWFKVEPGKHFTGVTSLMHLQHDSSVGLHSHLHFQLGKLRYRDKYMNTLKYNHGAQVDRNLF